MKSLFVTCALCILSTVSLPCDGFSTVNVVGYGGPVSDDVTCIAVDGDGFIWFGHDNGAGISRFDGETWDVLMPLDNQYLRVTDFLFDGNDTWISSSHGLYRYDGAEWTVVPETEKFPFESILEGPDGAIWFGGRMSPFDRRTTVTRMKNGNLTTWFVDGFAGGMAFDDNGNLWVGGSGYVYRYDGVSWTIYESDKFAGITKIFTAPDGDIWFATNEGFVFSYTPHGWLTYEGLYGLDFASDSSGTVWMIVEDTLSAVDGEKILRYDLSGMFKGAFNLAAFDTDGSLWLAGGDPFGIGVVNLTVDSLGSPEKHTALGEAERILDVQPLLWSVDGAYDPGDNFPLATGNTWEYRREFRPYDLHWEPVFEDRTVLTIAGTVSINDTLYYRFLDGRMFRKDGNVQVHEISWQEGLRFDYTPCTEETCESGNYRFYSKFHWPYASRRESDVTVGAETYNGYTFNFSDLHGEIYTTVPGIGMTSWRQVTDSGLIDNLYLQYARIGGVEIGTTTEAKSAPPPLSFDLGAPFPNPFNSATTLNFTIRERAYIRLDVFNVAGQKVRTLVDEELPPGRHTLRWNGSDERGESVASGVYIVRLGSGGSTMSRTLVFVK